MMSKRVYYFITILALLTLIVYIASLFLLQNIDAVTSAYYLIYTRSLAFLVALISLVLLYSVKGEKK
jgi:peptidoglycan/LPS O-acetylase OafA/YrhL